MRARVTDRGGTRLPNSRPDDAILAAVEGAVASGALRRRGT